MTEYITATADKKLSNSDIIKEIQVLHDEVHCIQKSIALILNILPHVVHRELVAHECKCRGFDY
jgi:hypothetical protein